VTLKLSEPRGQELLKRLAGDADIFIENFRPGTLERWNLGPDVLLELNPKLVIVRTTGFGQTGPYRNLPGFGTLAESISGFAHINGWPDKPPALPPLALGDSIAALTGAFSVMFALWWREHGGNGKGQVLDVSIYEPLFWILGPQTLVYDQLGIVQGRTGNAAPFTAPRNAYQASDGRWLGLSASAQSIAERVMHIIGHPELVDEPWFTDHEGRIAHAEELDALIQDWIGQRTTEEVLEAFAEGQAAIAPIYSIAEIVDDPQYAARETITTVDHPQLGPIRMQNVIPKMSETPGRIYHAGPALGEHNDEVWAEVGLTPERLAELRERGIV
jgi:crotonobetainyl-CoA:carnitine CoA-transferase CaiB-like acyl-CoA transferase